LLQLLKPFSEIEELNVNPFLRFSWHYSWVLSLPTEPNFVIFKQNADIVGYAFYTVKQASPFLPVNLCYLNQMGDPKFDQVWVEFNNVVCIPSLENECIDTFIKLVMKKHKVSKLSISMCSKPNAWEHAANTLKYSFTKEETFAYRRCLHDIQNIDDVLNGFSKNTRNKVRRAIRSAESNFGELSIKNYNRAEATTFLSKLGKLHIQQWGSTVHGSGFSNPFFVKHHNTLCKRFFEDVGMVEVKAGEMTLGYSYNLVYGDQVYFYCSGINDDAKRNKLKPGYVLHTLLMAYYAKLGFHFYDFMAGESQYKRSLSSERYSMYTIEIYKNSLPLKLGTTIYRFAKKVFSKP